MLYGGFAGTAALLLSLTLLLVLLFFLSLSHISSIDKLEACLRTKAYLYRNLLFSFEEERPTTLSVSIHRSLQSTLKQTWVFSFLFL